MPFKVRKQKCKDSKGNSGNYVTYNANTGKVASCHRSRIAAEAAARIRNANSPDKMFSEDAKELVKDSIFPYMDKEKFDKVYELLTIEDIDFLLPENDPSCC